MVRNIEPYFMRNEMDSKEIKGSCLCGKITYKIHPPFWVFRYCHCPRCRKATGSAHTANLLVPPEKFNWTSGQDMVVRFDLPEAKSFATCFCRVCGSPLPHLTRSGREMVVPAGSLDDDPIKRPEHSIWYDSRALWFKDVDELPKFTEGFVENK